MLKLFGAIIILVSSTALGFSIKHRLVIHINELKNFISCLDVLDKEMCYSLNDIHTSLENTLKYSSKYNRCFFENIINEINGSNGTPISEIWLNKSDILAKSDSIYDINEAETIKTFGTILGCGDAGLQENNIDNLKNSLNKFIDGIEQKKEKFSVASKMGIYAGIVIVVILI